LRQRVRGALFRYYRRLFATDDGRNLLIDSLREVVPPAVRPAGLFSDIATPPYTELGTAGRAGTGVVPIFITARFRSGSTLLWNLFRHIPNCTSYYEPLNERRWFNPAVRGNRIDATHHHAEEYWREYEEMMFLDKLYNEDWIQRHLYMSVDAWDPNLLAYVRALIEHSRGRAVLQFNRIDLRLPWFRRHFPQAKLVHLYRHPRDQWCSALMDLKCFPPDGRTEDFIKSDKFYTLSWARDLKIHFPFLDEREAEHPYQIFYYLWKLSYLFGVRYSDHSLSFESLLAQPREQIEKLLQAVNQPVDEATMQKLVALFVKPDMGKWRKYAPPEWFEKHERHCETVLADFFSI